MDLLALSPLDGRYQEDTAPLREYFPEFAFLRTRVRLELEYLKALSTLGICPAEGIACSSFKETDARRIKELKKLPAMMLRQLNITCARPFPPKCINGYTSD